VGDDTRTGAAVAALRETSVLFAVLIGNRWLKESFGARGSGDCVDRRRGGRTATRLRIYSLPPVSRAKPAVLSLSLWERVG